MARRERSPQAKILEQLKTDEEAIEFIKLNAPYLTMKSMRAALQMSEQHLTALMKIAQVSASDCGTEPRASDIEDGLGFLPLGTVIEQWQRGTVFNLSSDIKGITRITRHFALGDE